MKYLLFLLLLAICHGAYSQSTSYPHLDLITTINQKSPGPLSRGEVFEVQTTTRGHSVRLSTPVPVSVVFAIDHSGSMGADVFSAQDGAVSAAKELRSGSDYLGVVVYATDALWTLKLGKDFPKPSRSSMFGGYGASGRTNMRGGFDLGRSALDNAPTTWKIFVLMTDGYPNGGRSTANHIINAGPDLARKGITLITIGYGSNIDSGFLRKAADAAGGRYYEASTPEELSNVFRKALLEERNYYATRQISIRDEVSPIFDVVSGTLDMPPLWDLPIRQSIRDNFDKTKILSFPVIGAQFEKERFDYSYKLRISECDKSKNKIVNIRKRGSKVTYLNDEPGASGRLKLHSKKFPPRRVEINKCGVHVTKTLNEDEHTSVISIVNSYSTDIYSIEINDTVHDYWKVAPPPLDPSNGNVVDTHTVKWSLDRLSEASSAEFSFGISNEQNDQYPGGINPIQHNDPRMRYVKYKLDEFWFDLNPSDTGFPEFEKDLQTGISNSTTMFLRSKNRHVQVPVGTKVVEATNSSHPNASRFDYVIPFRGIAGQSPCDAILIKRRDKGYRFNITFCEKTTIPQVYTSPTYIPK